MKLNMNFLNINSRDIGIDLGTANIVVTLKGKGIILNEPSVVAIDKQTNSIIATGREAKEMLGRTLEKIKAIRPIRDGVIADFTATQMLLKNIVQKICKRYNIGKLRAVVCVPSGITEVEERAVEETILQAGAREVYLIEEPIAAAIGAGLEIAEPNGNIVVDIGGGTTEVAVVSLGGIVVSDSLRIAGDELDEAIINYVKKELNLAIGQTIAEEVKINLGCALPLVALGEMEIRGRDLATGLPKVLNINSEQVREALEEPIAQIVDVIKITLEKTPPELSSDVMERGIILTGGGALIKNLDKLISQKTGIPVYVTETPLNAVVRGAGKALDDLEKLKSALSGSKKIK